MNASQSKVAEVSVGVARPSRLNPGFWRPKMADEGAAKAGGAEGEAEAVPAAPLSAALPEGTPSREQVLDFIVDSFLRTLETGGFQVFAKCYRRLYKTQPRLTKCVYDQFASHLQSSIRGEIQELKAEGNLKVLFESLDKLVEGAKERETPAWRPSGVPEADVRSVVVPYLLKQREFLQKALKEKEAGNARLAEAVLAGRKKIADLQEEIERRKAEWQAVVADGRRTISTLEEVP
ncbi:polyamine-modulated factor 1-like [Sceloporus undulatus]|uniref:polyamine-modulated factor 1-like n=1 Tax=Sceloporus undulatus TaxID=8520 RepID=UPI001C4C8F99|nr:polyamine-modulated factor 1-like [Sceloporus undulatus]